jgi:hypothetical protein
LILLEKMERLTGDECTSQSPDAETDRTPGMEREQEVWYLRGDFMKGSWNRSCVYAVISCC